MQNWRREAECQYDEPEAMYPDYADRRAVARAKEVCADCPVRSDCFAFAMANSEDHGVWGGTTPQERVALGMAPRVVEVSDWVADLRRAAPDPLIDCGTAGGVNRHRRDGSLYDCEVCLVVKRDQDRESKRRQRARARVNGAA